MTLCPVISEATRTTGTWQTQEDPSCNCTRLSNLEILTAFSRFVSSFYNQIKKLASSWFQTILCAITTVLKNYLQNTDLPEEQGA